jgi:murein DD-endopeptidase MepM/ murein hydrolase activator NlpD
MVITQAGELNASTGWCVKGHTTDELFTFAFYHMQYASLNVVPGQVVPKGYPLGIEGATGNVQGRHLHVELYSGNINNPWPPPYGDPMDPMPVFNSFGVFF